MRNFRKRTIALCLASAITVLGSFATEAYQNSIVSLRIDSGSYGIVNLTAFTKKPYEQTVRTEQVNDNKYYIILPSTKSEITSMPMIGQYENIDSMQVTTFPGAPEMDGYTRITVNTKGQPTVNAITSLYIPDKNSTEVAQIPQAPTQESKQASNKAPQQSYWSQHTGNTNQTVQEQKKQYKTTENKPTTSYKQKNIKTEDYNNYNDIPSNSSNERMPILIGCIILSLIILFIIFLNKDKMASIVGDQKDFDFEDKDESSKTKTKSKSKIKNIRGTINTLDDTYKNIKTSSDKVNIITGQSTIKETVEIDNTFKDEPVQEDVIVDLDSLYNEKTKTEQDNNIETDESTDTTNDIDDLADFLNEFSFEEEPQKQEAEFNEELYENTINNNNLNFSNNDSKKLNQLLQNEISDDTLYNIEEFAPKKPIPKHVPTEIEILEKVIAEYTIKQNISFSKDDVDTIRKLINVELDEDFITDLRTNPKRTEEMKKEIEEKEKKPHKTSEMLILNVKDMLPDLSKEIKKQGNNKIESEVRPEVIYYSEGYEVSKLSVSSDLANISKAVHDKNINKFRPSDELPIVDNNYEVETLSIKDKLPNIADYNVNPLKYETKKTTEKVDETALLNSIANVQFKPFYEGVQEEFRQFDGFEIINNEEEEKKADEQVLMELEKYNKTLIKHKKPKQTQKTKDEAQKLLELISEKQAKREDKKQNAIQNNIQNNNITTEQKQEIVTETDEKTCTIDGNTYNILKSISCDDCLNCYLAKNNTGYAVISRIKDTYKLLKQYDDLRTENIQTRVRETLPDGTKQYIARVSIHKFIFNVYKNNMEFVMDLC